MAYHALVPAAGSGSRFGAELPKQYAMLQGKPVLQHALDRMRAQFPLERLYVVLAADDELFDAMISAGDDVTALRCGGATRGASVHNALARMAGIDGDDWIVVHDAVRPCIDADSSLRLQRELAPDDVGGFLGLPVTDTLKRVDADARVVRTESRDGLWRAQTPQMFRAGVLRRAFALPGAHPWTDEAQAVEALGLRPRAVTGHALNVKITFPDDLALASAILSIAAAG
jgi:2-C-methyl-D-erythritol 4-phosphate cytidylyltransferase